MTELSAEQKIRLTITGHPDKELDFWHEGSTITRWITGGLEPTAYIRLQKAGAKVIAYCPQCGEELGQYDADYGSGTYEEIGKIRANAIGHQEQHG